MKDYVSRSVAYSMIAVMTFVFVVSYLVGFACGKAYAESNIDIPEESVIEPLYIGPKNLEYIPRLYSFEEVPVVEIDEESTDILVSDEEIDLIALVTMAEAEGECEEGKRLVIDTVLNRVDNSHFPDTITEVIYQPNQFTSMTNGRSDRCYVKDDIRELVVEELSNRYDSNVIFFRTTRYSDYGVPYKQVEHHYFSKWGD